MGERQGTETREKREETKDKGQRTKEFSTTLVAETLEVCWLHLGGHVRHSKHVG
jgi:hypothetical protein